MWMTEMMGWNRSFHRLVMAVCILGDIYSEVKLPDHMKMLFKNLRKGCFPKQWHFYIPTNSAQRSQFLHILTNTWYFLRFFFFFLIVVILTGMKWYLIVVLTCISLMTGEMFILKSFAHFFTIIFFIVELSFIRYRICK